MEQYKRDFFISRIRAGYIPVKVDGKRLLIHHPDIDISLEANEEYIIAFEQAQDNELMTKDDVLQFLIESGLWSDKMENEYQNIVPKHIDYWKIELYKSILKSKTRDQIRKYLDVAKKEYERLHLIRHCYDYITDDGYANYIKSMFLISRCTTYNNELVDWSQFDINKVMSAYQKALLSPSDIRLLARTTPWTNLWSVLKQNGHVFDNNLTSEQQALLSWSIMFDRINESPDCPPDDVIEDDDMLDGWLLIQRRKREAEQKKQEIEGALNDKMSNADEIYVQVETVEDAQKIDLLNPPQITNIKKQRIQKVKEQGLVKEQEFKDVQQKRSMQMQQAYNQYMKGK